MNVFNLFAKLSLDKSSYEKNLKDSSNLTKKETKEIKNKLTEINKNTKTSMNEVSKSFAKGTISFEELDSALKEGQSTINATNNTAKILGINLDNAGNSAENTGNKISKSIGIIALNAVISITKEVINLGKKFINLITNTLDFADTYSDLSAQYDITTKSLQQFDYIASQNSTTLDSLLSAMTQMYNKAKEDNSVFKELGVSVKDANGNMKTMDELFWDTQKALDKVTNSGNKSAYMLSIYGRNANSVGEVLRKNTEELESLAERAETIGIILDEKTIQSASNFNDLLAEMKMRGKAVFANFIAGADGSKEAMSKYMEDLSKIISAFIPVFAVIGAKLGWEIVKAMGKTLINSIAGFFTGQPYTFETALKNAYEISGRDVEQIISNNNTTKNSTVLDNSNYNIEISIGSVGTNEEDAKALAEMIIKEIATQKQAGGRQ